MAYLPFYAVADKKKAFILTLLPVKLMQDSTFMSFMRKMQHENAARVDIRDESAQGLSGSLGCYKSLVYVSNKVLPFVTVRVCVCVHLHRALTPLRLRAQQLQTAKTAITSTASLSLSFSPCHTYTLSTSSSLHNKQQEPGPPRLPVSYTQPASKHNHIHLPLYTNTHTHTTTQRHSFEHNRAAKIPEDPHKHSGMCRHTNRKPERGLRPNG